MDCIEKTFKIIGKNIRKIRCEKGLSIKEFALLANISIGYLYKIENGKCTMSLDTFLNIADSLNVKVTNLLDD